MAAPHLARFAAAALIVSLGLSAAGCERAQSGEPHVLVIGEAPKIVDPAAGPLTAPQAVLLANVAQGLVRFDARGQIEPGLAERWNVSDDGLSYIFRLQSGEWPNGGGKITAYQVARLLRRQLTSRSENALKDTLGAVSEIVPMTDRVIEIRLTAPRPNLLQLLAQPEFAIVRDGRGTGPFTIAEDSKPPHLKLVRSIINPDDEQTRREEVDLGAEAAPVAVRSFVEGRTDLVLGGTFGDLPYARTEDMPRNALRFDPAAGLFGLVPARSDGPAADVELRRLLSQALDRQAILDALNVPGLLPRATVLEPGLDGLPDPTPPAWTATPLEQRRPQLVATADQQFGDVERPVLRIALPDAPGANLLLNRIAAAWSALGLKIEPAGPGKRADFALIDAVAPSASGAWYVRQFHCGAAPICDPQADEAMDAARAATVPAERSRLLVVAAQIIDEQQLFIPIAAPIRWSLVSDRVPGFATNRFARHTLTRLTERLNRERGE
jgi:peptide/nickel transport system substrate-binding protein